MIRYALEITLKKWKCKCRSHPYGSCEQLRTSTRENLRETYLGDFGLDVINEDEAIRKYEEAVKKVEKI